MQKKRSCLITIHETFFIVSRFVPWFLFALLFQHLQINFFIFFLISEMLKHVQVSPIRSRADSLSIRSSTSCASSLCGSPEPGSEPPESLRSHSRASSYSSLSEPVPQVSYNCNPIYIMTSFCQTGKNKKIE